MRLNGILTNSYIFIVVFVIFTILYIIYEVFKVNRDGKLSKYNKLMPFPTIKMEHLPNPAFTFKQDVQNCSQHIIPCDSDISCSKKCGADFVCTNVKDGEEIVYNNIKVGQGNWCLPKNTDKACGKYTGRAVWSATEGGGQGWKCECLYPALFDGPQCMNNKSCKDTSPDVKNVDQTNNVLVNSNGEIYDPNLDGFTPPGGVANPYALDKEGKPVYTCRCGVGSGNKQFVTMNDDPYYCHIEPCTQTGTSPLWDKVNQTCICPIDSLKNKDGTCVFSECPYGSWNGITQQCECDSQSILIRCNSTQTNWQDKEKLPMCTDPDNVVGAECISRCITNICGTPDEAPHPNECGGKNGYRIEYCPKGECAYCVNGQCAIDNNQGGKICCNCTKGEMYNSSLGGCSGQGREAGRGCFQETGTNARFFWVIEYKNTKSGCRYRVVPIMYSEKLCQEVNGEYVTADPFNRISDDNCTSSETLPGWRAVLRQRGNAPFDENNQNSKWIQIQFDYAENKCMERCLYTNSDSEGGGGGATIANRVEKIFNCMDVIGDPNLPDGSSNPWYNPDVGTNFKNLKDTYLDVNFWGKNKDYFYNTFMKKYKEYYIDNDGGNGTYHLDLLQPWEENPNNVTVYALGLICDGPFDIFSNQCNTRVFISPSENSCEQRPDTSGGITIDYCTN